MVDNRLDTIDASTGAIAMLLGCWVEVFPVEHLDPAPPQITESRGIGGNLDYPWATDPGGVFAVEGWLRRRGLPPVIRCYDAALEADDLLAAVTGLDVGDDAGLLAFANRWGLLRCATPSWEHVDSVAQTRRALADLQGLARWLSAMQHGRWRDRACPTLDEVAHMIGDRSAEHWDGSQKASHEILWSAFALRLLAGLTEAAPVAGLAGLPVTVVAPRLLLGRPSWLVPGHAPRVGIVATAQSLLQFLYLDLGRRAREQQVLLRLCKGCPTVFPVAVTNRKKRYHNLACKNRRAFQKWYSRPRNRRAHNARRSMGSRPNRRRASRRTVART
jgi:hypothetical protein